jgi:ADP-ribose pyrophosphatase YjhB (NUDIX family)
MKLIATINPENVPAAEAAKFTVREAARAIVYDQDGNVGLLHVAQNHYHKLPGGGLEADEDAPEALKRECREELGCDVEVYGEVGQAVEYRKKHSLHQISYCYLARVVGAKGEPAFTSAESAKGFHILWLPLEQARGLLASDQPTDYAGGFIVARDLTFLEAAGAGLTNKMTP